jgi:hypothetical protein
MHKRRYRTLRIPDSVAEKIYQKHVTKPRGKGV